MSTYATVWPTMVQVNVGRLASNDVSVNDNEVSGHHAALRWDATCRCWQVHALFILNCPPQSERDAF
jgi:hypothetical protein